MNKKLWFIMWLITDLLFIFFLWVIDTKHFIPLAGSIILGSLIIFSVMIFYEYKAEKKINKALLEFLSNPDILHEEKVLSMVDNSEKKFIRELGKELRDKERKLKELKVSFDEYEEYIELWAHEVKTPLSLMTFVLDNRKEDISSEIYSRMDYVRNKMQENIMQMLYYARLKSSHKDYIFEKVSLKECFNEVMEEYRLLLLDKGFEVNIDEVDDIHVVSDKKGLIFIFSQIISNSIKYAKEDRIEQRPSLNIKAYEDLASGSIVCNIKDNGIGIKACDLPFIFDKGFTGENCNGKKSTGMGLYIVKQLADNLKISVEAYSKYGDGFSIFIKFPIVISNDK